MKLSLKFFLTFKFFKVSGNQKIIDWIVSGYTQCNNKYIDFCLTIRSRKKKRFTINLPFILVLEETKRGKSFWSEKMTTTSRKIYAIPRKFANWWKKQKKIIRNQYFWQISKFPGRQAHFSWQKRVLKISGNNIYLFW